MFVVENKSNFSYLWFSLCTVVVSVAIERAKQKSDFILSTKKAQTLDFAIAKNKKKQVESGKSQPNQQ